MWCGPCQVMTPIFEELKQEFLGRVAFEEVDLDQNQEKAQEYGVMSIPTFVLIQDGKEMDRKVGVVAKESLREWIRSFLDT